MIQKLGIAEFYFKFFVFLFLLFLSGFILILVVVSVSAYEITYEQQVAVCDDLNLSFAECYELWVYVESNNTCPVCEECANLQCPIVNISSECSQLFEFRQQEYNHLLEMAKLDSGCSLPDDLLSKSECDRMIDDAERILADDCRRRYDDPVESGSESSTKTDDSDDNGDMTFWYPFLFIGGFILILLFIFKKQILKGVGGDSVSVNDGSRSRSRSLPDDYYDRMLLIDDIKRRSELAERKLKELEKLKKENGKEKSSNKGMDF